MDHTFGVIMMYSRIVDDNNKLLSLWKRLGKLLAFGKNVVLEE
jgi:hypothetical protein